ncbi:Uma2 family endonuclease [Kineosporia sp. NBRC 101731]|uniref:Uma2 family endonuclease n=1 Tax=Kineosporia sp. NBRC 101731 TaxID=3032199 RepID=UPI0024A35BB6|nr:Uma2 family endonuclease [Kineosporia sp. NBRC 101731]GLY26929.1 hypothetical protein Kisp02_02940 [Kineosporia sp. NBRC 101731]
MSAEPVEPLDELDMQLARLMHLARRRPLTIDDLWGLPPELGRTELLNGSLILTPLPDVQHQDLVARLTLALRQLLDEPHAPSPALALPGCNVFKPDSDGELFGPDVVVIDPTKVVRIHGKGDGVYPDDVLLAIEVTSSNAKMDLETKRQWFEAHGVPYVVLDRTQSPMTFTPFRSWPRWARPDVLRAAADL